VSQHLQLSESELSEVRRVLCEHLPSSIVVHVFGSRAGGNPKPWSDLDLVLEGEGPLAGDLLAELAEAFDESALAYKVDVVDRKTVSDAFGAIIDAHKIGFPL
jgi:predicted nucleotidyltransferase